MSDLLLQIGTPSTNLQTPVTHLSYTTPVFSQWHGTIKKTTSSN